MSRLDKFGTLPDTHLVPDLLAAGLKVVFCGTALGRVSAEKRAYYAHPGNFFWRTLHATGLTAERITPTDYVRLLDYRIGLTDLCKAHYGNDSELPSEAWDARALRLKILQYQPEILAFTSKTAASACLGKPTAKIGLGFQPETIGVTRLFALPSPSGQARTFWDQTVWQALANVVSVG